MDPVVIIGSGYAGYSVARELRRRDKNVRLSVLTADDGSFYSKPSLSEARSRGVKPDDLVSKTAEQMAAQVKGKVRTGVRVQAIDRVGHKVILDQEILAYSRLVLALGADPIRLPVSPAAEGRVFSVNDLGDYRRFVQAITGRQRIAILGAGFIGCEM